MKTIQDRTEEILRGDPGPSMLEARIEGAFEEFRNDICAAQRKACAEAAIIWGNRLKIAPGHREGLNAAVLAARIEE